MKYLLTLILSGFIYLSAAAQQGGVKVGQTVPNLSIPGVGGKTTSLSDYKNNKAVAIVFVSQSCPNSRLYESRLSSLAAAYAEKGVTFLFVHPAISMEQGGEGKADNVTTVLTRLTYLPDEGQKLSTQLGATKTPEVFLLQNTNDSFVLKYKGAIDDNPQLETAVKEAYLQNALDAVLAGRLVLLPERRATGCMIKRF